MADVCVTNSYEESRRRRLEENRKRFEDLGIAKISKSLADLSNPDKRSQPRSSKPKQKTIYTLEPRRSSRARNTVSYRDDVDIGLPPLRKRSRSNSSSWASYAARPVDECRTASYEERAQAFKVAEVFQSSLRDANPSFVKSMVRSHVYSCFWLALPTKFCEDHLSKATTDMALEDENGTEYGATYIGKRTGLSGGWRGFALDHKLDDGDALVFELIQPMRFKVYIFRASADPIAEAATRGQNEEVLAAGAKKKNKGTVKPGLQSSLTQKEEQPISVLSDEKSEGVKPRKNDGSIGQKLRNKGS